MHRAKGDRFVRVSELPVCDNGAGEGMVFPFFFPLFMFRLELKAYGDAPHVF